MADAARAGSARRRPTRTARCRAWPGARWRPRRCRWPRRSTRRRRACRRSTLFGDPALMTLRSLVNEGLRMRIQLSTIHSLMSRRRGRRDRTRRSPDQGRGDASSSSRRSGSISPRGRSRATAPPPPSSRRTSRGSARTRPSTRLAPDVSGLALSRRLAALAGQLRAVGSLAVTAGEGSGLRDRRPHARTSRPVRAAAGRPRGAPRQRQPPVAGGPSRGAAGSGRAHRRADLATPAAQPELLDGGGGGHHAAPGVRRHVHARRRARRRDRARRRPGGSDRGCPAPGRRRDRAARRRCSRGRAMRCSPRASRSASRSSPRWSCSS